MDAYRMIPQVEVESAGGIRVEDLETRLFMERKIFLTGTIDAQLMQNFVQRFLYLRQTKEPVDILIDSEGGVIDDGLVIYDLIQSADFPVNMYCTGKAYSMAALLLAGGQKGRRFIFPHGSVMIHEPLIMGGNGGSASTIQKTAESLLKMRDLTNGILAKHTGKPRKEINRATAQDNFMTAEEAVKFGICDEVRVL